MNKILSKSVAFISISVSISSIQFYSAFFLNLHACSCWHHHDCHHNSDDDDDDDDDDDVGDDGDVAGGRRKVIIG